MQNPKLAAALEAAAKGFRVFPVKANSKIPALKDWPDKATDDRRRIESWWNLDPDFNIGIATGHGLLVVDADTKDKGATSKPLTLQERKERDNALVRAANAVQARNHAARDTIDVNVATQDQLVALLTSGTAVAVEEAQRKDEDATQLDLQEAA